MTIPDPILHVVVMGVSGAGKSTVGAALAERLRVPFVDADALHPRANVEKMAAGVPLEDRDRIPWLERVGHALSVASAPEGVVVACSALKRSYRDIIRRDAPDAVFVELDVARSVLAARVRGRAGHFMPADLLPSQLATLEPLQADEAGVRADAGHPLPDVVEGILESLEAARPGGSCGAAS